MSLLLRAARPALGALVGLVLLGGASGAGYAQSATQTATRTAAPSPTPDLDWDLPGGHYYTQAGAGQGGYSITDDDGIPFWSTYQRLGGPAALGFPASRRYTLNGLVYQATQAAVLQWRSDLGAVVLANTFEQLTDAGKDDWLLGARGIPLPAKEDGAASFDDAVRIRLGWLTDERIAARYLANPNLAAFKTWTPSDSVQLYGLPMSLPVRLGPYVAQRFQRVAFQLWVDAVPGMPAPGSITPVLGGDLLKDAQVLSGVAIVPHAASALVNKAVPIGATPFPTPASFAATSTPSARPATATPRLAPAGATSTPAARPASVQAIEGTLSEYSISLAQVSAAVGTVRFNVTNTGTLRHNLHVLGSGVDRKTADLTAGRSGSMDVTFTEPGQYTIYCDIADHAERGMSLSFTIGS